MVSKHILLVDDDRTVQLFLRAVLEREGYEVTSAWNGEEALRLVHQALPDLILCDVVMEGGGGFKVLQELRGDPATEGVPVIMITDQKASESKVQGLDLGADDYVLKPVDPPELLARIRSKLHRPPVPARLAPQEHKTGFMSERLFLEEVKREIVRVGRGGQAGCLAVIEIFEIHLIRQAMGQRGEAAMARQFADVLRRETRPLDFLSRNDEGHFLVLMPETSAQDAEKQLARVLASGASANYETDAGRVRLTPLCGFLKLDPAHSAAFSLRAATTSLGQARQQLDLHPVRWEPSAGLRQEKRPRFNLRGGIRTALQIAATLILGIAIPLGIYTFLARLGWDITGTVYVILVISLTITSALVWMEGFAALRRADPPQRPLQPYPRASAIIAAYLPNEAPTVMDTIDSFLRQDYPARLQIILAYNTPRGLPIEQELQALAEREPRFLPIKVEGSTSKAQNVNAALGNVDGEFVGIFDADHQPDPGSFKRAWRWLSSGVDVVQGHCAVRNGSASWVARMVSVEFEAIYAVSHPGRARQHGFGIFGGSNGFWRTDLLRSTRMQKFMLTEDIDSTMRALETGAKFVSDPYIISRELAPTTIKALWNQRLRWAQGWHQVSSRHAIPLLRREVFTPRQKLGLAHLLVWREMYPWISIQIFPILIYWLFLVQQPVSWVVPIFLATTIFTLGTGPGQMYFLWRLADPAVRRRRLWLLNYFFASILYTEFKNIIARVAHIKEWIREKEWKVTPRAAHSGR